ncbi:MAG TPA: OmpA family protein [Polyangiales bacterium]|nr:OmpA family protein [Polyangiales bacterium]
MRRRQRVLLADEGTENFWPSFTDLISTISMILFVLVLLAYIQNLIAGKQLVAMRAELADSMQRIAASRSQLEQSQLRLRALSAEIAAGQEQLAASRAQIDQQQATVAESNRELNALRSKVQGIAVLRVDVLQKVKQSIDAQLRAKSGGSGARIADNGNIMIDDSLLFETDAYSIRSSGKAFLSALAKAFSNVLRDPDVRKNIDVILVQGHTDERGSIEYNRELSAKRANAVLNYMFHSEASLAREYGEYFASSAYSEFRPVDQGKSEAAFQQNRRIEISVVLKDAGIRGVIDEYMRNQVPIGDQ